MVIVLVVSDMGYYDVDNVQTDNDTDIDTVVSKISLVYVTQCIMQSKSRSPLSFTNER